MTWPPVWLLFVTYERTEKALRCAKALKEHLKYPNLHWHVCDDGSEGNHIGQLLEVMGDGATYHTRPRNGTVSNEGGSINNGIQLALDTGAVMHVMHQDDFLLRRDLDLRPEVDILEAQSEIGMIRLSYCVAGLAGLVSVHYSARMKRHYTYFRLIREWTMKNPWKTDTYLHSDHPQLVHQRYIQAYGWRVENEAPPQTELDYCAKYSSSPLGEDGPQILFPWACQDLDCRYVAL